eukprot:14748236-Alexandrium_andersonii.AAC.1
MRAPPPMPRPLSLLGAWGAQVAATSNACVPSTCRSKPWAAHAHGLNCCARRASLSASAYSRGAMSTYVGGGGLVGDCGG